MSKLSDAFFKYTDEDRAHFILDNPDFQNVVWPFMRESHSIGIIPYTPELANYLECVLETVYIMGCKRGEQNAIQDKQVQV